METKPAQDNAKPAPWWQVVLVGRNPKITLVRILVLVCLCYVLFGYILLPIRVEGVSMLPTYQGGRVNFVNRLAYRSAEPKRGDVVAVRFAGPHVMLLKRVIGLPGDRLEFHRGSLYVNGQKLEEPYVKYPCKWDSGDNFILVESGKYYVVGDNRSMPFADHTQGQAARERIMGRVLL